MVEKNFFTQIVAISIPFLIACSNGIKGKLDSKDARDRLVTQIQKQTYLTGLEHDFVAVPGQCYPFIPRLEGPKTDGAVVFSIQVEGGRAFDKDCKAEINQVTQREGKFPTIGVVPNEGVDKVRIIWRSEALDLTYVREIPVLGEDPPSTDPNDYIREERNPSVRIEGGGENVTVPEEYGEDDRDFYHPKWDEQDCPVRREPFKVLLTRNRNHLFDPSNENTLATSHFERRGTYYFFHWPFIRHEENAAIQFQLNALAYQHLDAAKEAVKVINAWVRRMRISNTAIISIDASKSYAESTQTDCGIHLISAYEGPAENPPTKLLMTVSGISKYEGAITDVDAWMNLNTIRSHEELALGEDLPKEVMTRWFVYVFLRALGGNDATGSRVSFLDRAHLLEQKNQTPLYTSHDEKLLQFLYGFDDGGSFVSPEVQEELDALQNIEQKILFETASAKIKVLSNGILDNVVEILQKYPTALIEIQAHTDSRGEDDYNIDLSKRRGQAVKDYLVSKGISSSRLSVKGFGESAPIADNNTADGRAKNRRVAFKVLNSES